MEKIPSAITRINLSDATFKGTGAYIEPTYINYFFGNNGTGKSTIAKAIQTGTGVEYGSEKETYTYLVYDKEFIENNVRSYHNLKGIFTLSENNGQIQTQIEKKEDLLAEAQTRLNDVTTKLSNNGNAQIELYKLLRQDCWSKTEDIREEFEETQTGKKKTRQLVEEIRAHDPVEHDLQKLKLMYDSAYSEKAKLYAKFSTIEDVSIIDNVPNSDILSVVIANAATTKLAEFLEHLGATEWFILGYKLYGEKASGKCPYCSRPLPEKFEQYVIDSFNDRYKENLKKLDSFYSSYSTQSQSLEKLLSDIPAEIHPAIDIRLYNDKLNALKGLISVNLERIKEKKAEPTKTIALEATATILRELARIITGFNKLIDENNKAVNNRAEKRNECREMVFEHMAFILKDVFEAYDRDIDRLQKESSALQDANRKNQEIVFQLQEDIKELRSQLIKTDIAVHNINIMLRNVGFTGFEIRPHKERNSDNVVYQVVRPETGESASDLSEGEKNFIAFLYFQQKVFGSDKLDYDTKPKIVVIDDPVSSMDSSALFIVAEQIRKMIEICRNRADNRDAVLKGNFIKQIFILTHNVYFHNQVTYRYANEYQFVSFYLVKKIENRSSVTLMHKQEKTQWVNVNPVKSAYAALWEEYKESKSGVALMSIIRRILVFYFLQLSGYDDNHMHKVILEDNKSYYTQNEEDYTKFHLASTMLSCIAANADEINEGLYYVNDVVDLGQCRDTFRMIFEHMGQEQHYNMMMGKCE